MNDGTIIEAAGLLKAIIEVNLYGGGE